MKQNKRKERRTLLGKWCPTFSFYFFAASLFCCCRRCCCGCCCCCCCCFIFPARQLRCFIRLVYWFAAAFPSGSIWVTRCFAFFEILEDSMTSFLFFCVRGPTTGFHCGSGPTLADVLTFFDVVDPDLYQSLRICEFYKDFFFTVCLVSVAVTVWFSPAFGIFFLTFWDAFSNNFFEMVDPNLNES